MFITMSPLSGFRASSFTMQRGSFCMVTCIRDVFAEIYNTWNQNKSKIQKSLCTDHRTNKFVSTDRTEAK